MEAAAVTPDDNKEEAQGDEEAPRWRHGPALRVRLRLPFRGEAAAPKGGTRARRNAVRRGGDDSHWMEHGWSVYETL